MHSSVTVKGQVTLPAVLRKKFGLGHGQKVSFAATKEGILVKPVEIEDLTKKPAWKKLLEEARAEAKAGKGKFFESGQEFLDYLKSISRKPKKAAKR